MAPMGIAVIIGTVCGGLAMNWVLQKLFSSSFEDVVALLSTSDIGSAMSDPIRVLPASVALQLLLCAVAVTFWVEYHIKRKPLELIKNKK